MVILTLLQITIPTLFANGLFFHGRDVESETLRKKKRKKRVELLLVLVGLTMSCSRVGHAAGRQGRGLSMVSLHGPTGAGVGPGTSNWGRSAQKQLPGYIFLY